MASASGNPTLDAANEATGVEPLNAGPNDPQTPQETPAKDDHATIPASLSSLPPGCEPVVLPLSLQNKTDTQENVAALPPARQFEGLVKAIVHPAGPARAEEMETDAWKDKYEDVVRKVREVVDEGEVKFYRVQTGKDKAEGFVMGLDFDRERYLGVRITGLHD